MFLLKVMEMLSATCYKKSQRNTNVTVIVDPNEVTMMCFPSRFFLTDQPGSTSPYLKKILELQLSII